MRIKSFSDFYAILLSNLVNYSKNKITKTHYKEEMIRVKKLIDEFINNTLNSETFHEFLNKTIFNSKYKDILCKIEECEGIWNKTNEIYLFANRTQIFYNLLFEKKWWIMIPQTWYSSISNISSIINKLIDTKKNYSYSEKVSTGTLTFKVNFGKISEILNIINKDTSMANIKIVRIFCAFTLVFDTDYKLNKSKYTTNAPDLVIISPIVIVEKPVAVDLSCETIPGYPENQKKARNGSSSGENGYNGKPGLPGYNSGNLIILADSISNRSNLITKLFGGIGGPGQDGIIIKVFKSVYKCLYLKVVMVSKD